MSQDTGLITKQSLPVGQHSTVVFPARTTQLVFGPQQKSAGTPA